MIQLETPEEPDAVVWLPLPQGQALNARLHWGAKAKQVKEDREFAQMAGELTRAEGMPLAQAIVTITWRGRGRMPDVDNIAGRCKAYLDGLQDAGWWADDKDIVWLSQSRERIGKGDEPKVLIRAWSVDNDLAGDTDDDADVE